MKLENPTDVSKSGARTCERCGARLSGYASAGLCPACMLRDGLSGDFNENQRLVASHPPAARPVILGTGKAGAERRLSAAQQFGDYELLEEIARGGMGVVYKARQARLNRFVAVKMILGGRLASAADLQRFRAEAEAAANLQHPNIVAIHEVGEHEGQHYFSMDYVEGKNLAQLISDFGSRLSDFQKPARYLKQIADAIHYAHQRGILHRDLKPSNVLIDQFDQPRITDFGLAKRLDVAQSAITLTGQVIGSPNYMPPEQAQGKHRQITIASDIYSLGAILYHLLTGRPPFVAETLTNTLDQLVSSEPTSPRSLNPNVPRDLETICLKCLEKEPARRYQTAWELAEELGRFLGSEPILARPIGHAAKCWRWCRRKPVLASFAAVSLVLLLVVAIGSPIAIFRVNRERQRADAEANHAKRAEQETREQLWGSYLAQARATRWSGRPGRRFESLEVIKKAAAIRPSLELRNEAIACFTLADVRKTKEVAVPAGIEIGPISAQHDRYVRFDDKGKITLHRLSNDQELVALSAAQSQPVQGVSLSPDGQWLSARSGGNPIALTVWDLNSQQVAFQVTNRDHARMEFSSDSRSIVTAFSSSTGSGIAVYDLISQKEITSFGVGLAAHSLALHPPGGACAIANQLSSNVEVWDTEKAQLLATLQHSNRIYRVTWHPAGTWLATGGADDVVCLWNLNRKQIQAEFKANPSGVWSLRFSHSGDLLACTTLDGVFCLWNVSTGRELVRTAGISSIFSFSPDDRWLGYCRSQTRGMLEIGTPRECISLAVTNTSSYSATSGAFDSKANIFFSRHPDGSARVWDLNTMKEAGVWQDSHVRRVWFPSTGTNFITWGRYGMRLWPLRPRSEADRDAMLLCRSAPFGPKGTFGNVSLDAASKRLITVDGATLRVFDAPAWREEYSLGTGERVLHLTLSANGKLAAWLGPNRHVNIWQIEQEYEAREVPNATADELVFSPDNKWLVTSSPKECRFWHTDSWRPAHSLEVEEGAFFSGSIAFSPTGDVAACIQSAQSIRLFQSKSGEELATLEAPEAKVLTWLQFSPDGSKLAAGTTAELIQVWDLRRIRQELAAMNLDWDAAPLGAVEAQSRSPSVKFIKVPDPNQDPRCTSQQIDLTYHYTDALGEPWLTTPGNTLDLPAGLQTLAGVPFDIRGIIQLVSAHPDLARTFPPAVNGIRVGQRCVGLHFLHATCFAGTNGEVTAEYVVQYENGLEESIPVIYGKNIWDWWYLPSAPPSFDSDTVVAWQGTNAHSQRAACGVQLYKYHWENPHPEAKIARIDLKSTMARPAPFLIAITAE